MDRRLAINITLEEFRVINGELTLVPVKLDGEDDDNFCYVLQIPRIGEALTIIEDGKARFLTIDSLTWSEDFSHVYYTGFDCGNQDLALFDSFKDRLI